MNLVASLIVKNELGRYLQANIAHLRTFCDLIAVVDDGSSDFTGDWLDAQSSDGQIVVKRIDPDDGFFAGHEGRRRNLLLEWTLSHRPDWVLAIDADEFITDPKALRRYVDKGDRPMGTLHMEEVWQAEDHRLRVRLDGGWRPHDVPILWRATGRRATSRWRIADRALACGREPLAVSQMRGRGRPTDTSILHFGWANVAGRQARYDRYVTADGGRFHKNAHLDSIMLPDADVKMVDRGWPPALEPFKKDILRGATE